MKLLVACCFLLLVNTSFSQKPAIGFEAIDNWVTVGKTALISNSGKYVAYSVDNPMNRRGPLVLQHVDGKWKKEIPGGDVMSVKFSEKDDVFFCSAGENLNVIQPGKSKSEIIPYVTSWTLAGRGKNELLIFLIKESASGKLKIRNVSSGNTVEIDSVNQFRISPDGTYLLLTGASKSTYFYSLLENKKKLLFDADTQVDLLVFSENSKQLACVTKGVQNSLGQMQSVKRIAIYNITGNKFDTILSDLDPQLPEGRSIETVEGFCADDSSLIICLKGVSQKEYG
jgi:WD40 repeat protein